MRLTLDISYLGAAYQGWKSQPSGQTVQDRLEAALGTSYSNEVISFLSGDSGAVRQAIIAARAL